MFVLQKMVLHTWQRLVSATVFWFPDIWARQNFVHFEEERNLAWWVQVSV